MFTLIKVTDKLQSNIFQDRQDEWSSPEDQTVGMNGLFSEINIENIFCKTLTATFQYRMCPCYLS